MSLAQYDNWCIGIVAVICVLALLVFADWMAGDESPDEDD